jgi:hypothetical protein
MTTDFEKVIAKCQVQNTATEGPLDYTTLSVVKEFVLPVDNLEEELA